MQHLDPELLALLALGEDVGSPGRRLHLADCAECRDELAGLQRPVAVGRTAGSAEALERPDPRVWTGIAATLGLASDADPLADPVAPVLRIRRRRRIVALAVAAAVLVVTAAGVGALVARSATETIGTATLRAFPGWPGERGTAVLERRADGERIVQLHTSVQPGGSTDHEVWLMTTGARRLVSLGLLHGSDGSFAVPAGLDVDRFDLVDVSDEPRDGNPKHSGDSIIRGMLHS